MVHLVGLVELLWSPVTIQHSNDYDKLMVNSYKKTRSQELDIVLSSYAGTYIIWVSYMAEKTMTYETIIVILCIVSYSLHSKEKNLLALTT